MNNWLYLAIALVFWSLFNIIILQENPCSAFSNGYCNSDMKK